MAVTTQKTYAMKKDHQCYYQVEFQLILLGTKYSRVFGTMGRRLLTFQAFSHPPILSKAYMNYMSRRNFSFCNFEKISVVYRLLVSGHFQVRGSG